MPVGDEGSWSHSAPTPCRDGQAVVRGAPGPRRSRRPGSVNPHAPMNSPVAQLGDIFALLRLIAGEKKNMIRAKANCGAGDDDAHRAIHAGELPRWQSHIQT